MNMITESRRKVGDPPPSPRPRSILGQPAAGPWRDMKEAPRDNSSLLLLYSVYGGPAKFGKGCFLIEELAWWVDGSHWLHEDDKDVDFIAWAEINTGGQDETS